MSDHELICFKRPYDGLYLVGDAPNWSGQFDFEGFHCRGSHYLRSLGWYYLVVCALSHYDREGLYVYLPEIWRLPDSRKVLDLMNLLILSYWSGVCYRGTELD